MNIACWVRQEYAFLPNSRSPSRHGRCSLCESSSGTVSMRRYRQGIEVALHYLPANHLDSCYAHLGHRPGSLPETEAFCAQLLSVPCHQ
jgi:hypothetical protein